MEYFHINQVMYGGYLEKAATIFPTRHGEAAWFSLRCQKADNQYGFVNVMCYKQNLREIVDRYIIPANIGKRLIVLGETAFPPTASKAAMINGSSITFVDEFINVCEQERMAADMPDFSND